MTRSALRPTLILFALLLLCACRSNPELVWHDEDGYRWAELADHNGSSVGFREVSDSRSGISFVNTLHEESLVRNRHYMNGSGVALGDVDGDGRTDIYFARLDGPNVLYRNLGGWRFEDITEAAGVAAPDRYSTGAVFADINGDGALDLLVTAMGGPNAVFLNNGEGRFTEVTDEAGLASNRGATTMALSDVDGDGDVDLYVSNYKARAVNDIYPPWERSIERTVVRTQGGYRIAPEFEEHYAISTEVDGLLRVEKAEPNVLYLNDGRGRFSPVDVAGGAFREAKGTDLAEAPKDWTLTARFQDVNGDGAPDLYVCNDFQSPDYFWLGNGKGEFRAVSPLAVRKTSFSTMSVDFSDIERDGDLDFFLTDMLSRSHVRRQTQVGLTVPMTTEVGEIANRPQAVQNTLHLNRGDGTYAEIARVAGLAASDWTWSGLFLDVDLDGYEDLLLATGHAYDVIDKDAQMQEIYTEASTRDADAARRQILQYPPLPLKNVGFRNTGDLGFEYVPDAWGIGAETDVSNALAFGDLDNDGDLDVVVNRLNDSAGIFRNEAAAPRIAVRLRGSPPNTQAIGAKIRVRAGALPMQEKEVVSGGIYLSGSEPVYTFAAGEPEANVAVEVIWRDGRRSRIDDLRPNRILEIFEDTIESAPAEETEAAPDSVEALFDDASERLAHRHEDTPFGDLDRQPLLRKQFSNLGPAVAWSDLNGDGLDDLIIGAGRTSSVSIYQNAGRGNLSPLNAEVLGRELDRDVAGIVATPTSDGSRMFIAVSNYEAQPGDSSWIEVVDISKHGQITARTRLPHGLGAVGPLALADVDNDGDLDLFAGSRLSPGQYPNASPSRIYTNDSGEYRFNDAISAPFREAGMVSSATFADFDHDGDQDIVLAIEWGPVRLFTNEGNGRFVDRTEAVGLDTFRGWWNGLAVGDFDGDGRLDIAATNWGWNSEHERLHRADRPVRLYSGDLNSDGSPDALEAVYDAHVADYVPLHGLTSMSEAVPYVSQRIPTFEQYARSTLREIVGFRLDQTSVLEANTLTSMVFLNRMQAVESSGSTRPANSTESSGNFEARPLPLEAQFAPAFAPVVGDYDGDGYQDLFLSQNFFAFPMDIPRQDAGRGLLLTGAGDGTFRPVTGQESGIAVYGEQRGAAASDVDGDGRLDLAVSQSGAATKLFLNAGRSAGLRIRLVGARENPSAVGATVRVQYDDGSTSPAQPVLAGSGYWSQNSAIQVVAARPARTTESVLVRWPDGHESTSTIPPDADYIEVRRAGAL